jgi:hypothetical protein
MHKSAGASRKLQDMLSVHPPSPNCSSLRNTLGQASSLMFVVILSGCLRPIESRIASYRVRPRGVGRSPRGDNLPMRWAVAQQRGCVQKWCFAATAGFISALVRVRVESRRHRYHIYLEINAGAVLATDAMRCALVGAVSVRRGVIRREGCQMAIPRN